MADAIDQRLGQSESLVLPLGEWACSLPVNLDGKVFTFERHEYLMDVYADSHPDITLLKATQMGLTTYGLLRAVYGCRYKGYKGVLYVMPSRSDALDVARGRVNPLMAENSETLGSWLRETDSASLKQIGAGFVYFRGMRSRVSLKSIPIDFLVTDELDEAPPKALDMAMERLSHSEFKHVLRLSNPTCPDFGIDKQFQQTDQRYWHLKCPSCGAWTSLEETFPESLIRS
jgi:phage terminase large subunit GpA-like protein